jgi:hypothetical protein
MELNLTSRLDDGVVVRPGLFEAMSKQFDGLRTLWAQDQEAGGGGTESTDHPQNILHYFFPFSNLLLRVGCGKARQRLLIRNGGFRGRAGNDYTFEYGFGSLRSCAWYWSPCGG